MEKADVQIYKKGTCFNIPASTNPTNQATYLCNFQYTVTSFAQNAYGVPVPTFVADPSVSTTPTTYVYTNYPYEGCSYQLLLDVGN